MAGPGLEKVVDSVEVGIGEKGSLEFEPGSLLMVFLKFGSRLEF